MIPTAKTTDSISIKAEIGVAHYLSHAAGVPAVWVTSQGEAPDTFPILVVRSTDQRTHPDLLAQDGTYLVDVQATLYWEAADGDMRPAAMDQAVASISSAMLDTAAAQLFLNLQETGVDSRPVDNFHLYELYFSESTPEVSEGTLMESKTFTLLCVAADQTFAAAATTANYLTLGGNYITLGGNRITLAS